MSSNRNIFARIPAAINTHDRAQARAYAFFICLKQYRYNGLIYNFKSRRSDVAKYTGTSLGTVRNYERELVLRGWAHWNGKHLQLRSYSSVWQQMGIEGYRDKRGKYKCRFYKSEYTTYKFNKNLIDAVPIYELKRKQEHTIKSKILALELNNIKACDQHNIPTEALHALVKKANQRAKSESAYNRMTVKYWKQNADKILQRYEQAYYLAMYTGMEQAPVTPYAVCSMAGLCWEISGKKDTPSTGHSIKQRLQNWGLIKLTSYQAAVSKKATNTPGRYRAPGICGKHRQLISRVEFAEC